MRLARRAHQTCCTAFSTSEMKLSSPPKMKTKSRSCRRGSTCTMPSIWFRNATERSIAFQPLSWLFITFSAVSKNFTMKASKPTTAKMTRMAMKRKRGRPYLSNPLFLALVISLLSSGMRMEGATKFSNRMALKVIRCGSTIQRPVAIACHLWAGLPEKALRRKWTARQRSTASRRSSSMASSIVGFRPLLKNDCSTKLMTYPRLTPMSARKGSETRASMLG
mmetsp:Transcript_59523/g.159459  ORF Transcript_59523/g.159459 Transcript_59523/m.159459 type:complete len:222 (+) Transcript_59523:275-940(+)